MVGNCYQTYCICLLQPQLKQHIQINFIFIVPQFFFKYYMSVGICILNDLNRDDQHFSEIVKYTTYVVFYIDFRPLFT